MDKALYVAMSGASQAWDKQAAISHNVANASTVGFKAALADAESRDIKGPGFATRAHALASNAGFDASSGHVMQTGRELDIALTPGHWLAVLGQDGETAYTRAGDLAVNSIGQLTTSTGLPVLGEGGPVAVPPYAKLEIGGDGTVSIVPQGGAANQVVVLDRLNVAAIAPEQLARGTDGLFRPTDEAEVLPAAGNVLFSGALEASNVNLAESLVQMIEAQRRFEMQVKAMQTADENAQRSAQMMRLE